MEETVAVREGVEKKTADNGDTGSEIGARLQVFG